MPQESGPRRRSEWSLSGFTVSNGAAARVKQDGEEIEAEEGEITQKEQELEILARAEKLKSKRNEQREIEERRMIERMEREERARAWKWKEKERIIERRQGKVKEPRNNYGMGFHVPHFLGCPGQ